MACKAAVQTRRREGGMNGMGRRPNLMVVRLADSLRNWPRLVRVPYLGAGVAIFGADTGHDAFSERVWIVVVQRSQCRVPQMGLIANTVF